MLLIRAHPSKKDSAAAESFPCAFAFGFAKERGPGLFCILSAAKKFLQIFWYNI